MGKGLSRRKFLEKIGLGAATGAGAWLLKDVAHGEVPAKPLPTRTLGRTGSKVSILAFGCGSRFLMYEEESNALAALNHAIDLGITYVDTAYAYGDGKSESRVGQVMVTRRKDVWLATKIPDRTRDEFLRRLEGSLKRLRVDHVDLLHIHSLGQADDLGKIEAPNGALQGLLEAREQKMARFIGMTHLEMLEHNVEIARNFSAYSEPEMDRLRRDLAPAREGLEHNLVGHLDGPTRTPHLFTA